MKISWKNMFTKPDLYPHRQGILVILASNLQPAEYDTLNQCFWFQGIIVLDLLSSNIV